MLLPHQIVLLVVRISGSNDDYYFWTVVMLVLQGVIFAAVFLFRSYETRKRWYRLLKKLLPTKTLAKFRSNSHVIEIDDETYFEFENDFMGALKKYFRNDEDTEDLKSSSQENIEGNRSRESDCIDNQEDLGTESRSKSVAMSTITKSSFSAYESSTGSEMSSNLQS